jgi:hypothetical protein
MTIDIRTFSITNNKRRVFSKNIKKCFLAKASAFSAEDVHDRHILFVTETRERQWERWERVVSEVEMMPNPEALNLHLKRCCWGFHY